MVSTSNVQISTISSFTGLGGSGVRRLRGFSLRCAILLRAFVVASIVTLMVVFARAGAFIGTSLFAFQSVSRERPRLRRKSSGSSLHAASAFKQMPHSTAISKTSDYVEGARRALFDDSTHFNAAVERALGRLQAQRQAKLPMQGVSDDDVRVLRQRINEVQRTDRLRDVSELLWLKVYHGFQRLDIPLVPDLHGDGIVDLGAVNLNTLATHLYSEDAVELIREHVLDIIGDWSHLVRDYPLKLALVQVGHVYSMSALFGYSLRKVDARYQIERRSGTLRRPTQPLRSYLRGFSPDALQHITTIASLEAELVIKQRTSSLFGDLRLLAARARHIRDSSQLLEAVANEDVESIQITVADLRRLALEGVALGFLLSTAEADVDDLYDLTPGSGECPLTYLGGGLAEENCNDFRSRIFGADSK